jgi:hypothetical protein
MLLAAAIGLVPAACGDGTTNPSLRLQGTYVLERVNGGALPFLAEQIGSSRLDIIGGTLILRADGSYSGAVTSRQTDGVTPLTFSQQSTGTFTVAASQVTFKESDTGSIYGGVLNGTRLIATRNGVTFDFVKE